MASVRYARLFVLVATLTNLIDDHMLLICVSLPYSSPVQSESHFDATISVTGQKYSIFTTIFSFIIPPRYNSSKTHSNSKPP